MKVEFKDIIGKTFTTVTVGKERQRICYNEEYRDYIHFNLEGSNGYYKMHHIQDCCEDVYMKQIDGDIEDITNSIIINAEEVTSSTKDDDGENQYTFYKIFTAKGDVTISWYGESNGHYSISVDFEYKEKK